MHKCFIGALLLATLIGCARQEAEEMAGAGAESAAGEPSAAPLAAEDGAFFEVVADKDEGRVLFHLPAPDAEGVSLRVIHTAGVAAGLGSNPVGLDRGYNDGGRIIAFRRIGKRVIVEEENWRYRASADNPLEKKAVADSFATSFIWAGEVAEETADGSYTVDVAGFLTGDVLNLLGWLNRAGQGKFSFADDRSAPDLNSILVFPHNVEMDAALTLVSDKPGSEVEATAPNGRAVTLTVHHSFVRLPDDGYEPLAFDPRVNAIEVPFYDFSTPLDEPVVQRYSRRFRLQRIDPDAASGPVKKPIVFYVDPGAPEQVRNALIEGARWWADAFEEAGFENAFRVELLPADAHPFDVRYNVILWTHRQTRGWSYGGGVVDPRTGEVIKAQVILGSQRVRQDRMIFEGLAGADKSGTGVPDDPVELALARIRQLSAHEVGHPLGFAHNFAASVNNRASVMDYPAPLVRATASGGLDFSEAYGVGVGAWDKFAVHWLYSEFGADIDADAEREAMIRRAYASGLKFVTDSEGRSTGAAHPAGSVWDNGADPVEMLAETMQVRRIALDNFGLQSVKTGRAQSALGVVIAPIYLYHRYQVAAAAKLVGGYAFQYSRKGDGLGGGAAVPAARQQAALYALLATLDPAALDLSDETLALLTPPARSFGGFVAGEYFSGATGPMFDLLAAADVAGTITMSALLHPARAARLIETKRRDPSSLGLDSVLNAMERHLFRIDATDRQEEIQRVLQSRYVSLLIAIAAGAPEGGEARAAVAGFDFGGGGEASPLVKARVDAYLRDLRGRIGPGLLQGASVDRAHREWLAARIDRHLNRPAPARTAVTRRAPIPPGSPIGAGMREDCWQCDLSFD